MIYIYINKKLKGVRESVDTIKVYIGSNVNFDWGAARFFGEGVIKIGNNVTIVPPFKIVAPSKIGNNCFLWNDCTVEKYVSISNHVYLKGNNYIGTHTKIRQRSTLKYKVGIASHAIIGDRALLNYSIVWNYSVIGAGKQSRVYEDIGYYFDEYRKRIIFDGDYNDKQRDFIEEDIKNMYKNNEYIQNGKNLF